MIYSKIKFVWDEIYVNPEEIADAENAQEVINQYSCGQKIPIRILEMHDHNEPRFMILAGEGALYPWKAGQDVELGMIQGVIWHSKYLREFRIRGMDNMPYQDICMYDSIKAIEEGENYPSKDAVAYKSISSFELYKEVEDYINSIRGGYKYKNC